MSNLIPPIHSISPPPICDDDDEGDDDFCDFRVTDLALSLSDDINGDDAPQKWESSATEDPVIPLPQSPVHTKTLEIIPVELDSEFHDSSAGIKEALTNGDERDNTQEEDNQEEIVQELEPLELNKCSANVDEEEEEIENIPFPPVFSPCVTPPENELRTSPEGADSEVCTDESDGYGWSKVSFPETCDLKYSETLFVKSDCEIFQSDVVLESELKSSDDFGDFADFSSHAFAGDTIKSTVIVSPTLPDLLKTVENDIVESTTVTEKVEKPSISEGGTASPPALDDNFQDYESVREPVPEPVVISNSADFDDDFDEFESATHVPAQEEALSDRVANLFPRALSEPLDDPKLTGSLNACLDDSSSVWGRLKDLEASQALKLQWSTSTASKKLLSSLNIDSRNILIGARWNGNVPRFAANLSCAPLEPVQADAVLSPIPSISRVSLHSSTVEDVVPAAQFDWNSSGLTNPLDCTEKVADVTGNSADSIADLNPLTPPGEDVWSSPYLPTTDFLLPDPAPDSKQPIELDTMLVTQMASTETEPDTTSEQWVAHSRTTEQAKEECVVNGWALDGSNSSWTISSQLETKGIDVVSKPQLSAEACRVVETLPDLSFLSARKLLYTANENLGKYHKRPLI